MKQNNKEINTGSKAIANQALQKKQNGKSFPSASLIQLKEDPIQNLEEEETLQGKFNALQIGEKEEPLQGKFESDQKHENKVENKTGLPDNLKSGIENLSGLEISDVKVNYNSSKPAQLNAHAFAQGTDIHLAPGQEKHLPHEAWHTVQQKQGRVQPTTQMKENVNINDNESLENEATQMGKKASDLKPQSNISTVKSLAAPKATTQLVVTEDEISRRTAKPLNSQMKQTVRNQFLLNDHIKGFDKSSLKSSTPITTTNKEEVSAPSQEVIPTTPIKDETPEPSKEVSTPPSSSHDAVNLSTAEHEDVASMPGFSKILKGVSKSQAETDKHGDASILDKGSNAIKSTAAHGLAKAESGVEKAKTKGSSILENIKEGASGLFNKAKSFFGFGPKEAKQEIHEKPKNPDEPSTFQKIKETGAKVGGSALLEGGASLLKNTVGKVGDVGVEGVKSVQSGIAAKESHDLMNSREENIKGKEGSDRDLGSALAKETRNEHIGQALVSGGKVVKGVAGMVKTGLSAGTDTLIEGGVDLLKTAGKAAIKGGAEAFIGGKEKNAINDRKDLTLGESFAGKSKTEAENLNNYKAITAGKGELSEEDKKAAAKSRSSLFKEGFDRSAGYVENKQAAKKINSAQSMDNSNFSSKHNLAKESIQHSDNASQMRDNVNTGAHTLSPSDFKARGKDINTVKAIGDKLNKSDASFTSKLTENEELSHNRMATVSERIDAKKDELKDKL